MSDPIWLLIGVVLGFGLGIGFDVWVKVSSNQRQRKQAYWDPTRNGWVLDEVPAPVAFDALGYPVLTDDDKKPRGDQQAAHWSAPLPQSMWCEDCGGRKDVVGRFAAASDEATTTGVSLACGHRADVPS